MPRGPVKGGVSKGNPAARAAAAATAVAASAGNAAATAAPRQLPAITSRPTTRSSPAVEPDARTAAPRTPVDLPIANASGSPPPRSDIVTPGAVALGATNEVTQLQEAASSLRAELAAIRLRMHELVPPADRTTQDHATRPAAGLPTGRPAGHSSPAPFVPPAPPPIVFHQKGHLASQGLLECIAALSVASMGSRVPHILSLPMHTFTVPSEGGSYTMRQPTQPLHFQMASYLSMNKDALTGASGMSMPGRLCQLSANSSSPLV